MSEKNILTLNSKVKDLYATPMGYDLLNKLLMEMNIPQKVIKNPLMRNLKLGALARMMKPNLGEGFFETLIDLANSEKEESASGSGTITKKWWKEAVFYYISQEDAKDLQKVTDRLEDLHKMGVNALWVPYICEASMESFEELLIRVHEKGMHLIMDLSINHTSEEHEWFKKALEDEKSKYRDFYFLRKGNDYKKAPNNWTSFSGGSAWKYYEEQDVWALHLLSDKEPDLNWDNKALRKEMIEKMNLWLDKGVDGLRVDMVNCISKHPELKSANPGIGRMLGARGMDKYFYGPNLHKYLKEIKDKAFASRDAVLIGQPEGLGMKMCQLISGEERRELDMVMNHIEVEEERLNELKDQLVDWMLHYGNHCWMSLSIHQCGRYEEAFGGLLAVLQFTMKGTPFLFEENETYKQLALLRKQDKTLVYGSFEMLYQKKNHLVYKRSMKEKEYIVECNLSKQPIATYDKNVSKGYRLTFSTKDKVQDENMLQAYEARIWCKI